MKCKCCSKEFEPKKEFHYISRDVAKTGLAALSGGDETKLFDTFDCPNCGCQNVFGERKRTAFVESALKAYDGENIAVEIKDCKPLPSCFGRHDECWEDCELSGSCMNETRTQATEETTCDKCDGRNAGECDCTLEHESKEVCSNESEAKF